ncbi:MAG: TraX family protein [Phycisphaerales bacterium]
MIGKCKALGVGAGTEDPCLVITPARNVRIDKLRGLAILLMILDHVLCVIDPENIARYTLTRAALPIFMLISGYLLANRNPSLKRYAQLVAASFCSLLIVQHIPGMAKVDVLFVIAIVLTVWPIARRYPIIALCIGAVQSQTLGLWDGYEPGHILAIMCAGALLNQERSTTDRKIATITASILPRAFTTIGQAPLLFYLSHLAIIRIAHIVIGNTYY